MSSGEFATDLRPDPALRRLLLVFAAAAMLAGMAIALHLDLSPLWRAAIFCVWLGHSIRELRRMTVGMHRVRHMRLASTGEVTVTDRTGDTVKAQLRSGTVVLPVLAWLRLRFPDGLDYGELLRCKNCNEGAWHRLQLIWHQRHASFGRMRGS